MGCNDKIKSRCLSKTNARCVDYEGDLHADTNLDPDDCHSVDEVIEDINAELDDINSELDLEGIDESCIDFEEATPGTVNTNEAILAVVKKLKEVMQHVGMSCDDCPECEPSCNPIFEEDISCLGLDYGCLADECGDQPTNLKSLLQIIINQTCANVPAE